jgi:hypothetical protein
MLKSEAAKILLHSWKKSDSRLAMNPPVRMIQGVRSFVTKFCVNMNLVSRRHLYLGFPCENKIKTAVIGFPQG